MVKIHIKCNIQRNTSNSLCIRSPTLLLKWCANKKLTGIISHFLFHYFCSFRILKHIFLYIYMCGFMRMLLMKFHPSDKRQYLYFQQCQSYFPPLLSLIFLCSPLIFLLFGRLEWFLAFRSGESKGLHFSFFSWIQPYYYH